MTKLEVVEGSAFRLSWGAIIGGTVVTLAVWVLLYALGMAAGLTAIDPNNAGSLRGAGIGTGVWSVIVPLIALFIGGIVTAHSAGIIGRGQGAVHGFVLWGLTACLGLLFV